MKGPRNLASKRTSVRFSIKHSTNSLYETSAEEEFVGPFAHIRSTMDYAYHNNYTKERQWLQDSIIDKLLSEIVTGEHDRENEDSQLTETQLDVSTKKMCTMPVDPWLIYVAGTEMSNRSMTIKKLLEINKDDSICNDLPRFPILGFVLVDSREIRSLLPEHQCYLQKSGRTFARNNTRKETGYICEVLTRAALQAGTNVLVYGALGDPGWYKQYFQHLKADFDHLNVGILHVAAATGEPGEECQRISKAIDELMPNIHFFCKLQSRGTNEDIKILTKGITWKSFQSKFLQERAFVPETINKFQGIHRGDTGFIREFSTTLSTEDNYQSSRMAFDGPYAHLRKTLDYTYHKNYKRERQMLQDAIIHDILKKVQVVDANSGEVCTTPTEPFLVFTAGAMGAGKSYTLKKLQEKGRFPLSAFVTVDPDEIRQYFPEYSLYVIQNPSKAGEMTRKEAGYIVEILTLAALQAGKNVLVDGSLRDWEWYSTYFKRLRNEYPSLKIALLHVDAPREAIFARAQVSNRYSRVCTAHIVPQRHSSHFGSVRPTTLQARGEKTGRVIPKETLELALHQVPKSVEILRGKVDFYCKLNNSPDIDDIEIVTDGVEWQGFQRTWQQTCAWIPKTKNNKMKLKNSMID
jgi:hypothetical protein